MPTDQFHNQHSLDPAHTLPITPLVIIIIPRPALPRRRALPLSPKSRFRVIYLQVQTLDVVRRGGFAQYREHGLRQISLFHPQA